MSSSDSIPAILYHYTSRAGLLGIINSRTIWASNVRFLNDEKELQRASEITRIVLDELVLELDDHHEKSILEYFRDGWRISLTEQNESYVFSLSENADQLSQWRGYTRPSDGYAIGLATSVLVKLANDQGYVLKPCQYDEPKQRELIKNLFLENLITFRKLMRDGVNLNTATDRFTMLSITGFLAIAPTIKDGSFKEEKEWRFIAPRSIHMSSELKHRAGKSMIIPYHEFKLGEDNFPISDLIIGPNPHGRIDSIAVMSLLRKVNALNIGCRWSAIPYRDW